MNATGMLIVLSFTLAVTFCVPQQTKLKNCRLVINEWNAGTTSRELQFVELKAYCSQQPKIKSKVDMSRYRLVVTNPLQEVVMMCHSTQTKMFSTKTEFYFTYGGANVSDADMRFADCQVDSFVLQNRGLYLPTGIIYPFGLALLYNQRVDALNVTELDFINNRFMSKTLPRNQWEKIGTWLQDFYVYGSSTKMLTCDSYRQLLSAHTTVTSKVVRDWNTDTSSEDYSVNRCTSLQDSQSFQPNGMRYADPTPGRPNKCSDGFEFTIENTLPELAQLKTVPVPMRGTTTSCYISSDDPETFATITTQENFELEMEIAQDEFEAGEPMDLDPVCASEPACSYTSDTQVAGDFDIDLGAISNHGEKFLWDNCDDFPQNWVQELKRDKDTPLDVSVLENKQVCFWYEYLEEKKVGRCKLCNALLEQGIMFKSRLDKIMREGYMYRTATKNRKNINKRKITHHIGTDIHKISLQYFQNIDKGLRGDNLTQAMMEPEGHYYQYFAPTQNLIISVYQAVKMGLTFRMFKIFTETLKFFKVNVGHVHNNEFGMKTILMHIDKMMRNDLSNYLREQKPEVSITLDSSTDIAGKPSLAVSFQTYVAQNRPKVFFYRLIPLKGESGEELFKSFKSALEEDKLDQYIREKISGYVSDGCSVMTSTFLAELKNWAQTGFINTWCVSHRLELVSKHSLRSQPLVKLIEGKINALATFFGAISPKKRRVLEEAARSNGYAPFTLQRIHDIRWSESKHRAMKIIVDKWEAIIDALKKISIRKAFVLKTRTSAKELIKIFSDGTFISTLAFLVDVSESVTEMSLLFQERAGTMIGKRSLIVSLRQRIAKEGEYSGQALSALLQNSVLADEQVARNPTLYEFETKNITYKGQSISSSGTFNSSLLLSVNRPRYVSKMLEKLDEYFNEEDSTNFDIFDPIQMESHVDQASFGVAELTAMNRKYRWNYNLVNLLAGWMILRRKVVYHTDFPTMALEKPEIFWEYFLDLDDADVGWTADTRSLVRKVLSVGASSSEAERIFSMSNAQKTKQRYNLKVETVSALLSIRANGVNDLRKLESFRYAKEFVREHSKADDVTRKASPSKIDDEDFFLAPFDPDYSLE